MPFYKLTLKEQIGEREWWYGYLIQTENEEMAKEKVKEYILNFYDEIEDDDECPEFNEESKAINFGDVLLTWSLEKTTKEEFSEELLSRYTIP